MKIKKIEVKNFRLLKNVTIELNNDLSTIIGKNNCGKTSLLLILEKFLNGSGSKLFSIDDFNIECSKIFKDKIFKDLHTEIVDTNIDTIILPKISLRLFIEYDENDDLSNVGNKIIMDLNPENRTIVLSFDYDLLDNQYIKLLKDLKTRVDLQENSKKPDNEKIIAKFLKDKLNDYFEISKKSLLYDVENNQVDETVFTDLVKEKISLSSIISFKTIGAKRTVENKENDKTLSILSANIYNALVEEDSQASQRELLQSQLAKMDDELDETYKTLFSDTIEDIKLFGGLKENDTNININSSLIDKNLLANNTVVTYDVKGKNQSLPEHYNGLGYMNLISIILEVKVILNEFKNKKDKPADINLLFIEEPEAHTHPQMQAIFIKNIKALLKKDSQNTTPKLGYNLQTILTTHSPHIVAESQFEDIKYFKRDNHSITCKNLTDLQNNYQDTDKAYRFLKQYLTIYRADLFFADKAIFVEGDTERILLPAMMKKIDNKSSDEKSLIPLLSQNISIIDVGGRHIHLFDKFIDFIGVKTLIITDIDTVAKEDGKGQGKACPVKTENAVSDNPVFKLFFGTNLPQELSLKKPCILKATIKEKKLSWIADQEGLLKISTQTEEESYWARSFEDAFIHINQKFIQNAIKNSAMGENFTKTIVNTIDSNSSLDAYNVAEGIYKKPSFAIDILLYSLSQTEEEAKQCDWRIPAYIEEGLKWLQKS